MAIAQILEVWNHDLSGSQQQVALAFADHANEDGTGMWPSVDRVAWKTGLHRRTVQRKIRELCNDGILVKVAPARHHRPAEYAFDWDQATEKPPFSTYKDDGESPAEKEPPEPSTDEKKEPKSPDPDPDPGPDEEGGRRDTVPPLLGASDPYDRGGILYDRGGILSSRGGILSNQGRQDATRNVNRTVKETSFNPNMVNPALSRWSRTPSMDHSDVGLDGLIDRQETSGPDLPRIAAVIGEWLVREMDALDLLSGNTRKSMKRKSDRATVEDVGDIIRLLAEQDGYAYDEIYKTLLYTLRPASKWRQNRWFQSPHSLRQDTRSGTKTRFEAMWNQWQSGSVKEGNRSDPLTQSKTDGSRTAHERSEDTAHSEFQRICEKVRSTSSTGD